MATTPPEDDPQDKRYDQPGRNGLGKFAGLNFARAKNIPTESADEKVSSKSRRGPADFARLIAPAGVTPDQGCFATIIGAVLLIISIGFWFFIYYTHADEFSAPDTPKGPSRAQVERDRQEAHRNRLNP